MWRSDQSLTASHKRRLDDNAGEAGYLDAALLSTCPIPGILTNPRAFFATWTDSRQQQPDDSILVQRQTNGPEYITFHYKNLGAHPLLLVSVHAESASNRVKRVA
jgi:hypothetical protein